MVVIIGQRKIQIHFLPIIFFASEFFRSFRKQNIFTIKHIGTVGLIVVKPKRAIPISVHKAVVLPFPIAKKIIGIRQKTQYNVWSIDVIFKAFNVFIEPLPFYWRLAVVNGGLIIPLQRRRAPVEGRFPDRPKGKIFPTIPLGYAFRRSWKCRYKATAHPMKGECCNRSRNF